tara:strand:- start:3313 stop:3543 length:231 start_codon:yes stop_codon:yes gene_type:complete
MDDKTIKLFRQVVKCLECGVQPSDLVNVLDVFNGYSPANYQFHRFIKRVDEMVVGKYDDNDYKVSFTDLADLKDAE